MSKGLVRLPLIHNVYGTSTRQSADTLHLFRVSTSSP